ncbi:hypothetical protein CRE_18633 [Caenorhabditis remanei]|uniref:Uncharacterized protein n=1 Tax=Caenorhabditis remanei TaxID=31234 RepID=E3LKF1_CAERE|nr:hypothetical protein CRE_18633 [Caenorhabditis remanei]
MSFGEDNPTFEELMEVVQRQQEVIEIFEQQMEASREECLKIAEESEKKSEIIKLMETSEILLKSEIESLRNEKEEATDQKAKKKREESREDDELETVEVLRMKCKEMTYKLEKQKTQQTSLEVEIETQKKNNEFIRTEIEEERRRHIEEKKRLTENLDSLEKEMYQKCEELQKNLSKTQIQLAEIKTELEVKEHREKQLERLYEDVMTEINETRKEKSAVMVRCSSMTAENAELKAKVQQLRARLPRNDHDIEDMNKLLGDQSHLISALREETKLLARKLEIDSRDYRLSALLNIIQLLILFHVYLQFEPIENESVSETINFVFLVHLGVSSAMIFLAFWNKVITPNMIGFSLYSFTGSLSLYFISDQYLKEEVILKNWSILLSMCGFCSLTTCWWSVYKEKFCNLW